MTVKRLSTWAGIAMAFGVIGLTSPAFALEDTPGDTTAASAPGPAEGKTPLALRPARPLELAQEPAHTGAGWKIVALGVVLGGAALYLRKRGAPKRVADGRLTIVRRASVGIRSELLVVDVEGQRLLLGVTPHSIQSLAILDGEDGARTNADTAAASSAGPIGQRFAAMLSGVEGISPAGSSRGRDVDSVALSAPEADRDWVGGAAAAPAGARDLDDDVFTGQARGLAALRRR